MKELTTITWNSKNVFNESNEANWVGDFGGKSKFNYAGDINLSYISRGGGSSYFMPYLTNDGRAYFQVTGSDCLTFEAPTGKKFTKIEINYGDSKGDLASQANWTKPNNNKIIWSGTPSNAVNLIGKTSCNETSSIVFTLMDE